MHCICLHKTVRDGSKYLNCLIHSASWRACHTTVWNNRRLQERLVQTIPSFEVFKADISTEIGSIMCTAFVCTRRSGMWANIWIVQSIVQVGAHVTPPFETKERERDRLVQTIPSLRFSRFSKFSGFQGQGFQGFQGFHGSRGALVSAFPWSPGFSVALKACFKRSIGALVSAFPWSPGFSVTLKACFQRSLEALVSALPWIPPS